MSPGLRLPYARDKAILAGIPGYVCPLARVGHQPPGMRGGDSPMYAPRLGYDQKEKLLDESKYPKKPKTSSLRPFLYALFYVW